jgi:hypothetical protein
MVVEVRLGAVKPGETAHARALEAAGRVLTVLGRHQLGQIQYADLAEEMRKLPSVDWGSLADELRHEACRAAVLAGQAAEPPIEWTTANTVSGWAKVFGVGRNTMAQMLRKRAVRNRQLSPKTYLIAIADVPAKHQAKYRPAGQK